MANTSKYTWRSPQFLDLSDSKLTWYDMILPDDQIISNPHADPQVPHSSEHWPLRLEQLSYCWSIERHGGWSGGDFTNTLHDRTRRYWILRFQPGTSGPQPHWIFDGFWWFLWDETHETQSVFLHPAIGTRRVLGVSTNRHQARPMEWWWQEGKLNVQFCWKLLEIRPRNVKQSMVI